MEDGQSEGVEDRRMETIHGETGLRIEEDHQEEVGHQEAEDHPEDHLGRSPGCLGVRRKERKATKLISKVCLLFRSLEPGNLHSEMRLRASAEIRKEASYG